MGAQCYILPSITQTCPVIKAQACLLATHCKMDPQPVWQTWPPSRPSDTWLKNVAWMGKSDFVRIVSKLICYPDGARNPPVMYRSVDQMHATRNYWINNVSPLATPPVTPAVSPPASVPAHPHSLQPMIPDRLPPSQAPLAPTARQEQHGKCSHIIVSTCPNRYLVMQSHYRPQSVDPQATTQNHYRPSSNTINGTYASQRMR